MSHGAGRNPNAFVPCANTSANYTPGCQGLVNPYTQSPLGWVVELSLFVVSIFTAGALFAADRTKDEETIRVPLRLYAVSATYTAASAMIASLVSNPRGGEWVIWSMDVVDGVMYAALYLFLLKRIELFFQMSQAPMSAKTRAAKRVLQVINMLIVVTWLVLAPVGAIMNEHAQVDGYWFISVCWDCRPQVACSAVALVTFTLTHILFFFHARLSMKNSTSRLLSDDTMEDQEGGSVGHATIRLVAANIVASLLSCLTSMLVMFDFMYPSMFSYMIKDNMVIFVDVIINSLCCFFCLSTGQSYTAALASIFRSPVRPIVVSEGQFLQRWEKLSEGKPPTLTLRPGNTFHLFISHNWVQACSRSTAASISCYFLLPTSNDFTYYFLLQPVDRGFHLSSPHQFTRHRHRGLRRAPAPALTNA